MWKRGRAAGSSYSSGGPESDSEFSEDQVRAVVPAEPLTKREMKAARVCSVLAGERRAAASVMAAVQLDGIDPQKAAALERRGAL